MPKASKRPDPLVASPFPLIVHTAKIGRKKDTLIVAMDPTPLVLKVDKFENVDLPDEKVTRIVARVVEEARHNIKSRFGKVVVVQCETLGQIRDIAKEYESSHILFATKPSLYSEFILNNVDALPIVNKTRLDKEDLKNWRSNPIKVGEFTYYKTLPWRQVLFSSRNPFHINLAGLIIEDLGRVLDPLPALPFIDMEKHDEWLTIINDMDSWKAFFKELVSHKDAAIALDTETRNLERVYDNRMLTLQISWDGKHAYVIAVEHKESKFSDDEVNVIRKDLKNWLERGKSKYLVGFNLPFDLHVMRQFSGASFVNHKVYDLMAARYLIDENSMEAGKGGSGAVPGVYNLGGNALQFGSFAYMDSPIGKSDRSNMESLELLPTAIYGGIDGIIPWHLANIYLDLAKRQDFPFFEQTLLDLAGASLLCFTDMEHNGIYLDVPYLREMAAPDSPLKGAIDEAVAKLRESPIVKEVNDELAQKMGFRECEGLFEVQKLPWVFDEGKKDHQVALFIDKLGLKPLAHTKTGLPKLDKTFFDKYQNVEECKLFAEIKLREKVYSTNITSFWEIGENSPDNRVRSRYGFYRVTTMRSSSTSPNLQNLPNHGPYAKPCKRQFTAPEGRILISYDLNANEVKNFGNIAKDKNITDSFGIGMLLRRKMQIMAHDHAEIYRDIHDTLVPLAKGDPEDSADIGKCFTKASDDVKSKLKAKYPEAIKLIEKLAVEGDIHRMNVQKFRGIPAQDVSKTERQEIKGVVFGTLYGMGPYKLSQTIWPGEWEPYLYMTREEQMKEKPVKELIERARDLQESMWKGWPKAKEFVDKVETLAKENLRAATVTGTLRHLWGYLSPYSSIKNQQSRQANNSMVQGPSSAINTLAGRICHSLFYQLRKNGCDIGYINNNSVHDANYFEGNPVTLPIAMYFITHAATDLTAEYCRKYFNWSMIADPEIDFTAGLDQTRQFHMNWTLPNFIETLESLEVSEEVKQAAIHNFKIVNDVRATELKLAGSRIGEYNLMTMKPKDVPNKGFIFEV